MYATVLTAQTRTKVCAFISMLCAVVSVALNIILLPKIGVWSSAITTIIINMLAYAMAKYISKIRTSYVYTFMAIIGFLIFSIITICIEIDNIIMAILVKTVIIVFFACLISLVYRISPWQLVLVMIRK